MSAGTIVISGGILAGVILLCIVAVLCYCRLQYYCCKKNDSEVDMGSVAGADPLSHFPCNACNALAMDGAAITPISLDQLEPGAHRNPCPTCSPYSARSGLTDGLRNGGERLGFHTYYENPCVSLPLSTTPQGSSPLSYYSPTDMFPPPPRPYSTQVPAIEAKLQGGRLEIMDDVEEPLDRYMRENYQLQQASLRLEQENDTLAHRLIISKVALRNALDKVEDRVDELSKDLFQARQRLHATEEEKRAKEEEAAVAKEVFRRELEKAEREARRSSSVIAEYKQICSQLTIQLERQQAAHRGELLSLKSAVKSCSQCRHIVELDGPSDMASPTTGQIVGWGTTEADEDGDEGPEDADDQDKEEKESLRAQIKELEQELAKSKLQTVEAKCKIQELEHQKGILTNDLQEAKNTWISKALTSMRTSSGGGLHSINIPRDGAPTLGWSLHGGSLSELSTRMLSWSHRHHRENV